MKIPAWLRRFSCLHLWWDEVGPGAPGLVWHQCRECGWRKEFRFLNPPISYVEKSRHT